MHRSTVQNLKGRQITASSFRRMQKIHLKLLRAMDYWKRVDIFRCIHTQS